ncbi:Uncharacterized protein APZ42_020434 [Daphnia magna]|uniref:Uncharacterized protein n=1 Tax=Daphnia magna TaxID=35525 RepID=A0A164XGQ8_9CRUS|nr:Uncharacterized protein APZ42_020434 [Daphnia magna]
MKEKKRSKHSVVPGKVKISGENKNGLTSSTLALAFAKDSSSSDGMNDEHVFGEGRRRCHGGFNRPTQTCFPREKEIVFFFCTQRRKYSGHN